MTLRVYTTDFVYTAKGTSFLSEESQVPLKAESTESAVHPEDLDGEEKYVSKYLKLQVIHTIKYYAYCLQGKKSRTTAFKLLLNFLSYLISLTLLSNFEKYV